MADVDVVIVGGGISGLSAAHALVARGVRLRLIEREAACGGVIQTDRIDRFVIDTGPDTLLAHKPAAIALAREVGLGAQLVPPLPKRTTYVLKRARLRTLPETSALGLPTDWKTLVSAGAFSWPGKLRMAAEAFVPRSTAPNDESIGSFVRRRFGHEALTYVAEPVLAGLHRGDAARLSMRALFPVLANAERTHGSVARAWRRMPAPSGGSGSMSLRGGLSQLVGAIQSRLPGGTVLTGREVRAIESGRSFTVTLSDGSSLTATAVVLATPAYATSTLVAGLDRELARLCGSIEYAPSVNVAVGYARERVANPLEGWGFVVPARDRRRVRSASWVSSKWPGRAPEGHVLIRASVGAPRNWQGGDDSDEALVDGVHQELRELLGISGDPVVARVYRRPRAMPQMVVGHLEKMAAIETRLASLPGVFITASGFRGIGLPACISDAQATASRAAALIAGA